MRKLFGAAGRYGVLAILLMVCIVSAYVNAKDEEIYYVEWTLRYTYIWTALPLAVLTVYGIGVALTRDGTVNYLPTLVLLIIFSADYLFYALNGTTDPDTAAHMHLVLAPLLLGVLALPVVGFMLGRLVPAVWKLRRKPRQDLDRVASVEEAH